MRPISSYAKFQMVASKLRRNRSFQLQTKRIQHLDYLDVGCGANIHAELINLDYNWRQGVDLCWDITRGLPFRSGTIRGIFSEHCLEHFDLDTGVQILRDCHRVLGPDGVIRIIVPDAGLYLDTYAARAGGGAVPPFPYESAVNYRGKFARLLHVNRVYYQDRSSAAGHRCMYDFELLALTLEDAGFHSIIRTAFGRGRDPVLLIDTKDRAIESLYVEAIR